MRTLFIGQHSIYLKAADSTNSYASEMLRHNALAEGSIIYTFDQQKGRGQRGNEWECEPNKNVALSLVLYPSFLQLSKQFLLNKIISLSVADLMAEMLKGIIDKDSVKVKWPNDIYVTDKKIAGILIENSLRENSFQNSIVGIGINVNQLVFPANVSHATSLALIANKEFDLTMCVKRLCEFIEARYLQLKANKLEMIDNEYLQNLYRLNEWSNYTTNNQLFVGKIIGVATNGKLRVELKSSGIKEFDLKEITFNKL